MYTTWCVFQKEIRGFANSPAVYIFLTVFLVLSGAVMFYLQNVFTEGVATMAPYFRAAPAVLLIFVPAIAMRLWAEENKAGTLELLMTLPIRDWEAVLGKFLASAMVVLLSIVLTLPMPLFIASFAAERAPVDPGAILCGYLGLAFTSLAYLAIAGAVSAMTRNQIVAYIIGLSACFAMHSISSPQLLFYLPGSMAGFVGYLGIDTHSRNFSRGILDTRDVLYFASLIFLMLYATVRIVESRRWR
jgi:ABC-2 type transport system permease protein